MKKNYVFPVKSNLLSLFSGFLCSFFVFVLINFKSSFSFQPSFSSKIHVRAPLSAKSISEPTDQYMRNLHVHSTNLKINKYSVAPQGLCIYICSLYTSTSTFGQMYFEPLSPITVQTCNGLKVVSSAWLKTVMPAPFCTLTRYACM